MHIRDNSNFKYLVLFMSQELHNGGEAKKEAENCVKITWTV